MKKIKIFIASDHAGFNLKSEIIEKLSGDFEFLDLGIHSKDSCNYNEISKFTMEQFEQTIENSTANPKSFSILICKTGQGMCMSANKFEKIRAIVGQSVEQIELARMHNNANVLCFGEQFTKIEDAVLQIKAFTSAQFDGGRHSKRINFSSKLAISLGYNEKIPDEYEVLETKIKNFSSGETEFEISSDISGREIVIFQTFGQKINDQIMLLILVCDVLKRNRVKSVTLFAPFLPYMRQDKTYQTQVSLGSKIFADLIKYSEINNVITYDLHAIQIEGFFSGKITHLSMMPRFLKDIKERFSQDDTAIVFPDSGSASRFKDYICDLNFEIAIMNKQRLGGGIKMSVIGSVANKNCIILDDMIDSGGTLIEAAKLLKTSGALEIYTFATHGIFSKNAIENLEKSIIKEITVSNSLSIQDSKKIRVLKI